MLFRTQIIFCSSELRLHFRIAEVGSLLSLNRAWRAQVTFGTRSGVFIRLEDTCYFGHRLSFAVVSSGYIFVSQKWDLY